MVDGINLSASRLFDLYVSLFGDAPRWVSLCILAAAAGVLMVWIFGLTSRPAAIRRARKLLAAHLLEMRLYNDEPALVGKALGRLLRANLHYLSLIVVPACCTGLVLLPLMAQLDRYYGRAPLQPGVPALFTIQGSGSVDGPDEPPTLDAPSGIRVETPAVRVAAENRLVWRILAASEASGTLRATFRWGTIEKQVEAGRRLRPVVPRRVSNSIDQWLHPGEALLSAPGMDWAEIDYPESSVQIAGVSMHWMVAFLLFSMPVAFACKRKFGAAF